VPDWNGVAAVQYQRLLGSTLEFTAGLDWLFSDDFLLSSNFDPLQRQPAYNKFNARIAVGREDGRWELALLGRNLTDEDIQTISGDVPLSGGSPFFNHTFSGFFEPPRSIAVQLTLRY
jgi:hypothetical protein